MSGADHVSLVPGTRLHAIMGRERVEEQYFCNYEVNPAYVPQLESAGLRTVARGPEQEVRAMEMPAHRFFLAMLFQPQLSSKPEAPHPVVTAFLQAAAEFRRSR